MNHRTKLRVLSVAALLAASPFASHANSDVAMDACIKAFIAASVPQDRKIRIDKQQSATVNPVDTRNSAYEIHLTARTRHTGQSVARATCVANADGVVIAMNSTPAAAPTKTAAR